MNQNNAATIKALKTEAARKAVSYIKDGMLLGLGSGSTSEIALAMIGQKVKEGMNLRGIPSSEKVAELARDLGIPLVSYKEVELLDLNLDGADEVDPNYALIKGGGAALLREKINAFNAKKNIIMVDQRKMVPQLGAFPLPVEVIPFGHEQVGRLISQEYGIDCSFRKQEDQLLRSDNGNYILDCSFGNIPDPARLDTQLKAFPGVVETGLFIGLTSVLVLAKSTGVEVHEV